ncbi:MAG: SMC family ATPase [Clostridia bacterium]|nr:SMC family ATPase [Clostridia bacterium]
MIPVELRLRNFMSYGEDVPSLNFSGFHLACLTGSNGNGKSALLDAITWALWGQARGVDKNGAGMDDLIRLGAEEMEVDFTFLLEGNHYRVVRKRDKRRAMSALEFQVAEEGNFRSITGDKLTATQEKILQILKVDYETFVNSAFILQGKADTFTQQKPNDRKRILGEILGLSYYDQLERRARDKMNHFDQLVKVLDQELAKLDQELVHKDAYQGQLEELNSRLEVLQEEIKVQDTEVGLLREGKKELDEIKLRMQELTQRVTQSALEMERLQANIQRYQQRIEENLKVIRDKEAILAGYERYQEAIKLHEVFNAKTSRLMELTEKKNRLEKKLHQEQQKLEKQLSTLQAEIKQYQAQIGDREAREQELTGLRRELESLVALERAKQLLEEEDGQLDKELAGMAARQTALNSNLNDLRERFSQIKKLKKCPYCTTSMESPQELEKLVGVFTVEAEKIKKDIDDLGKKIEKARTRQGQIQEELKPKITKLKVKDQVQGRLAVVEQERKTSLSAEKILAERLTAIKEVEQSIQEIASAGEDHQALLTIEKAIAQLGYDRADHEEIKKKLEELKPFEERHRVLTLAEQSLIQEQEHSAHLQETLEQRKSALHNEEELAKIYRDKEEQLAGIVPRLAEAEEKLYGLRNQQSKLEETRGVALERYNRCVALEGERKEKLKERDKGAREKSYYAELVEAFGRKGIQAIIIENAIPELQDEANLFLAKMTDGRLNIELVTQKGNKRGNTVETLEIEISDELGKRKYEMYSGGEAFRVNFALRLALSKLLAKRAGAKLQTLVIDEGFGTQDNQGKERLVEVINAIREDFEKIIIITHIQELKDAFPVRIEITKSEQGSLVAVS